MLLDCNNAPIILQTNLDKGLLDMVNRGLVPKHADLTPAFNRNGHPLTLITKQTKLEKEVEEFSKFTETSFADSVKPTGFFVTGDKMKEDGQPKLNIVDNIQIRPDLIESSREHSVKRSSELTFEDFKIVEDYDYRYFYAFYKTKWKMFRHIIKLFENLLKLLDLRAVTVDGMKLEDLINSDRVSISNKDLIGCLNSKIIKHFGLEDPVKLFAKLKESSVNRIQKYYRGFKIRKFVMQTWLLNKKVRLLQLYMKIFKFRSSCKKILEKVRIEKSYNFEANQRKFVEDWRTIKQNKRVEVHICSISNKALDNSAICNFAEKQNNQLSRLIRLQDPDVELIIVVPFELPSSVISYYFSVLEALEVHNYRSRIRFIVPV